MIVDGILEEMSIVNTREMRNGRVYENRNSLEKVKSCELKLKNKYLKWKKKNIYSIFIEKWKQNKLKRKKKHKKRVKMI